MARVVVSIGGGSWEEVHLVGERNRDSLQWWELSPPSGQAEAK